jgi:phage terminase large subunit-like protein
VRDVRPRWQTPVPDGAPSDGDDIAEFVTAVCKQTKDTIAGHVGEDLVLRPWQSGLLHDLFVKRPDGRRQFRRALVGLPRKNGKSALSSGIALAELFFTGPDGAEIFSCAADRDQARIVFGMAKQMVELSPTNLKPACRVYRDAIERTDNGSVYRVLSSEAFTKEGLSPTLVIFDEVHAQPNDELWNVMSLAAGARREPLLLGITTAGVMTDRLGNPTLCHRLWEHGRKVVAGEVDDPSFFFAWWGAPDGAAHDDPDVWAASNPGFDDIVDAEDFAAAVVSTPENEFRTKRLNQWVTSAEAWLPAGAWDALEVEAVPEDGARVVLGFDGSYSDDSTALVGCTVPEGDDDVPGLFVVAVWESAGKPPGWTVPREEVDAQVDAAMRRWDVAEFAADPPKWESEMERWEERYGEVVVRFDTFSRARMAPACNRLYAAVTEGRLAHDGSEVLGRHFGNAVTKQTPQGTVIVKDSKSSPRKIDAAVASVVAHDRAMWHATHGEPAFGDVWFAFT